MERDQQLPLKSVISSISGEMSKLIQWITIIKKTSQRANFEPNKKHHFLVNGNGVFINALSIKYD